MKPRSGITPSGRFIYGIHKPAFRVENFRINDFHALLGNVAGGPPLDNRVNFPEGAVEEEAADWIYEIPNAFPFRGTTYIAGRWAEKSSRNPEKIGLPKPESVSLRDAVKGILGGDPSFDEVEKAMASMPETVLLSVAATSTDPADLVFLAKRSCEFVYDEKGNPTGLVHEKGAAGRPPRARFLNHTLFEVVVNNIHLPDPYKRAMVLRPGVQGASEIVGEWGEESGETHIFEYLRRNSYIPWGHYAANMADDAVRYRIGDLMEKDMAGLRGLYYQRTFVRAAEELGIPVPGKRRMLTQTELETLRLAVSEKLPGARMFFNATLWGWNYGFDFASSGFRLHASHQMIHQQYAMLPNRAPAFNGFNAPDDTLPHLAAYGCGDLVADFTREYRKSTGNGFFEDYIRAIRANTRMDGKDAEKSLVIHEDENVMLFVPKAQTAQWELQLMPLAPAGNILEANTAVRNSLDTAVYLAMKVLTGLGARMITTIEFPKRFDDPNRDQHLLYAFLPKMPDSPGAFSEAQLRWINGHFPEDFAAACRARLRLETKKANLCG